MTKTERRNIENGIWLENIGIFLPWRARLVELESTCQPDLIRHHPAWDEVTWKGAVICGGLETQGLETLIFQHGWLDSLTGMLYEGHSQYSAAVMYDKTLEHLLQFCGKAESGPKYRPGASTCPNVDRITQWKWAKNRISLVMLRGEPFEKFSHSCMIRISHME
jgi:hypothetical protein